VNDAWKVYDVLVEGVSVVSTYRKSYTDAAIRRGINHVIERIAVQNRKFSPV
jgi:ABC-type transporter MlaC component